MTEAARKGEATAKFRHTLSGSRPSSAGGQVAATDGEAFIAVCLAPAGGMETVTKEWERGSKAQMRAASRKAAAFRGCCTSPRIMGIGRSLLFTTTLDSDTVTVTQ